MKTEGRGRTVDEWKLRPDRRDNHWLDGVVGCAVAASVLGCTLPNAQPGPKPPRKRIDIQEMYRLAKEKEAKEAKREGFGWFG